MNTESVTTTLPTLELADHCWNRIGVMGDSSCPELSKHVHCRNCPVFAAASQTLFTREVPPEYQAEWTNRLAQVIPEPPRDSVPLVIFRLADEWFAWNARSVMEVTDLKVIRRIPSRTNRLLLGLVNIRGELHMCLALRELLSIPDDGVPATNEEHTKRRFVVTTQGNTRWVFPVDEVSGVRRMPLTALSNVPTTVSHAASQFTQGVFTIDGHTVGYLADEFVFAALEGKMR
jgi:chemotaxis-related protein WspD